MDTVYNSNEYNQNIDMLSDINGELLETLGTSDDKNN